MKPNQEFTIESMPNNKFRVAKLSPIDVLALSSVVDFEKFEQNATLFKYALEHIEVEIGGKWFVVKQAEKDIYMPMNIEKNYIALRDLIFYFTKEVLGEVFQSSDE